MRYLAILLLLAGCATAPARPGSDPSANAAVQELIVYASDDFHQHGPTGTTGFRNVRGGYLPTASGERQYMLCGEFQKNSEWVEFTTIKTSKYEQWIGGQSTTFCKSPEAKWMKGDFSAPLQSRLASLRR
jgi:hypothetical protein